MVKVKKDIKLLSISELFSVDRDINIEIDGEEFISEKITANMEELRKKGMIKGKYIVVPKGTELTNKTTVQGKTVYEFGKGGIVVDLEFGGKDDEYLG